MIKLFRKLAENDRGAIVIELALIAPIFALTVAGIVDVSNAFGRKLQLEQGAQRAIEKIMQTTGDDSVEGTLKAETVCQVNGINADGSCKTSPITESNVTVTFRLECIDSSTRAITSSRTSTNDVTFDAMTCASTEKESRYIQIGVTHKYTPMFSLRLAGLNSDGTFHISATAGMRTQ